MDFVYVPSGEYYMGASDDDLNAPYDEKPTHRVSISKPFFIGRFEVRVSDFKNFVDETGYITQVEKEGGAFYFNGEWTRDNTRSWKNPGFEQEANHPVTCISWFDAIEFANYLSLKHGLKPYYKINGLEIYTNIYADGYRLPTEAEWEYAARGFITPNMKTTKYYWGEEKPEGNLADETAKKIFPDWTILQGYDDKHVYTAPVGTYKPNSNGLYDMIGNVWEWCEDWFSPEFYKMSSTKDPINSNSTGLKVLRGSSWRIQPQESKASTRGRYNPNYGTNYCGFRLVLPI